MKPDTNRDAAYWARVHIEGDRRKPVELRDRRGGKGINAPIHWRVKEEVL